MRWPWVSRRAYDDVADERDRLRAAVDRLTDDLVRLARKEGGLPERRPEQRKRQAPEPLPTELRNLLSGFESQLIRDQLEHEARNALRSGTDKAILIRALREQLGVPEAEA